ncbi:MAG: hypothetical protein DRJ50_07860, partial [Actinobacteria bacterium]
MTDSKPNWRLSRRGFLAGTIATALAACADGDTDSGPASTAVPNTDGTTASTATTAVPTTSVVETTVPPAVLTDPFTLGVASGDPLPDSVILWTRLHPEDPLPDDDIEVEWEVATDDTFEEIVASGTAPAVAA